MISIIVISKNEPALEYTLTALQRIRDDYSASDVEIVVVDVSSGALDYLRSNDMTWIDFEPLANGRVSIPHQRNAGVAQAKGDIIVFTDAGCEPLPGWLETLTEPISNGRELVVAGAALGRAEGSVYDEHQSSDDARYVNECPTINVAFDRAVFDKVGVFDETFAYGSDVDFAWRIRDAGIKIFRNPNAIVTHDWGSRKRQAKRSYAYGRARARLYRKHRSRIRSILRNDPIAVVYPLFILGLPLTMKYRLYPLLLLVPLARNRDSHPVRVVADHLFYGAGVLRETAGS